MNLHNFYSGVYLKMWVGNYEGRGKQKKSKNQKAKEPTHQKAKFQTLFALSNTEISNSFLPDNLFR